MKSKEVTIFDNVHEFENFILNEVKERDMPDFFNEPVGTLFWDKHLITKQFLIDNGKLNEAK